MILQVEHPAKPNKTGQEAPEVLKVEVTAADQHGPYYWTLLM